MDGLEWKRSKYGKTTRRFLKLAESLAAKHADKLIADSTGIRDYLKKTYNKNSVYIPYGADVVDHADVEFLKTYDLKAEQYNLLITRMEPENNVEMIIRGYLESEKKFPLVIVSNYNNSFGKYLRKKYPHEQILYPGAIYNQDTINAIRFYASLYFHGHSVGGTNPSLLEAMGCGCVIATHDNPFNKAILTDCGYYFSNQQDVTGILNKPEDPSVAALWKERNAEKLRTIYNWDKIINDYEELFLSSVDISSSLPVSKDSRNAN